MNWHSVGCGPVAAPFLLGQVNGSDDNMVELLPERWVYNADFMISEIYRKWPESYIIEHIMSLKTIKYEVLLVRLWAKYMSSVLLAAGLYAQTAYIS
jgi:hypothetical protein